MEQVLTLRQLKKRYEAFEIFNEQLKYSNDILIRLKEVLEQNEYLQKRIEYLERVCTEEAALKELAKHEYKRRLAAAVAAAMKRRSVAPDAPEVSLSRSESQFARSES